MEIRFVLRHNLRDQARPATIYCRITLDGVRAGDFSTFEHVIPDQWHAKGQVVTAGTPEATLTNEALANTRNALREILNRFLREDTQPTANRIKAEFLRKDSPARTLLQILEALIERKTLLKRAKGTLDANRYKRGNLEAFMKATGRYRMLPGEFNEKLADEFEFWLRSNLPSCGAEHVAKHLQLVKETLKLAVRLGDIARSPLEFLSLKREKPKRPLFLSLSELRRLASLQLVVPALQRTADLFVFCCFTGLAYEDLTSFDASTHIRVGVDGLDWIYKRRGKTDEQAILPLFEGARRILEKYGYQLPYIRNDHFNNFLKQVAAIAGLPEGITTHTARKTAANLWHNEAGLPMDDVALMMGHADPETTRKYYVQSNPVRIVEAAGRLRGLLS